MGYFSTFVITFFFKLISIQIFFNMCKIKLNCYAAQLKTQIQNRITYTFLYIYHNLLYSIFRKLMYHDQRDLGNSRSTFQSRLLTSAKINCKTYIPFINTVASSRKTI